MKIDQEIREYLADRYDCDPNTDIETEGQHVHVTAIMPNTSEYGQFYAGDLADIQRDLESDRYTKDKQAYRWACDQQGFVGNYEKWVCLPAEERAEYEAGAAGFGTI
jgi:hypothetical protein